MRCLHTDHLPTTFLWCSLSNITLHVSKYINAFKPCYSYTQKFKVESLTHLLLSGVQTFFDIGKAPDNLCAACKDDCSSKDDYSGYTGAFKCMFDGAGDVAFVKHTTTSGETSKGYGSDDDYEYLCKDGTRKGIHV